LSVGLSVLRTSLHFRRSCVLRSSYRHNTVELFFCLGLTQAGQLSSGSVIARRTSSRIPSRIFLMDDWMSLVVSLMSLI